MRARHAEQTILELRRLANELAAASKLSMVDPLIRKAHDDILAILDRSTDESEMSDILTLDHEILLQKELRDLNAAMHLQTEIELAEQYLSASPSTDPFEGAWINKGFFDLLTGQVSAWKRCGLFRDVPYGRVFIVGGGALPQSQIAFHIALGCQIVSIERDPLAADLCRRVLVKAGHPELDVVTADGTDYDYDGAYLVVVATLVQEKNRIARQVARTAAGAIFAPRTPVRLHRMWREPVSEGDLEREGWSLMDRWEPPGASIAQLTFVRGSDNE